MAPTAPNRAETISLAPDTLAVMPSFGVKQQWLKQILLIRLCANIHLHTITDLFYLQDSTTLYNSTSLYDQFS